MNTFYHFDETRRFLVLDCSIGLLNLIAVECAESNYGRNLWKNPYNTLFTNVKLFKWLAETDHQIIWHVNRCDGKSMRNANVPLKRENDHEAMHIKRMLIHMECQMPESNENTESSETDRAIRWGAHILTTTLRMIYEKKIDFTMTDIWWQWVHMIFRKKRKIKC